MTSFILAKMHACLLLVAVLLLAGCGSDEPWADEPSADDGGTEASMGTFNQTRLGNQITVPGGILANGQPPPNPILLLEANLGELSNAVEAGDLKLPELGFGPWVFMVDIEPIWGAPAGGVPVNPLKLRFNMGSGGAAHRLEIDAVGGAALQVPTAVCRVEVFWDRLPTFVGAVPAFEIPTSVIVRGTLHRANIVPNARRSFLLARDAAAAATTNGLIPPYAFDWMIYAQGASSVYAAASSNIFACSSPAITIISLTTGPQMAAALATGARFPIPPMVDFWQVTYAAPANFVTLIDFGVGF
jgi:hypothetical protein